MVFSDLDDLVKARRRALDEFVQEHWDLFGPQAIEEADIDNLDAVLYTGAMLLLRSRDMDADDEVVIKAHTGLGFSEQLGLLETVADMMKQS